MAAPNWENPKVGEKAFSTNVISYSNSYFFYLQKHKDDVMDAFRRLHVLLKDDDLPWNSDRDPERYLKCAVVYLLRDMLNNVK